MDGAREPGDAKGGGDEQYEHGQISYLIALQSLMSIPSLCHRFPPSPRRQYCYSLVSPGRTTVLKSSQLIADHTERRSPVGSEWGWERDHDLRFAIFRGTREHGSIKGIGNEEPQGRWRCAHTQSESWVGSLDLHS